MNLSDFYNEYKLDTSIIDAIGFNPYYQKTESVDEDKVCINNAVYIDLASNNYLGIANCTRLKNATHEAVEKYGVSLCATPIALGYSELYERVSNKMAAFVGLEDCIIYPTCYQANNGLFSSIVKKDDVVLIDQYAHSSLIEGVRTTGCKIRPFLHNNPINLEKILKVTARYKNCFVVTESVFSTEGSIAPLKSIDVLCQKYNAISIIDDSHGLGSIGSSGKGILDYSGCKNFSGIYTASLGKAIGNMGGVICGKKSLLDYLRYFSPHLVYSTALPPHILAGVFEALKIIEEDYEQLSKKLWQIRDELVSILIEKGYTISNGKAPIISVKIGEEKSTLSFARDLFKYFILSTPFIYPSVPRKKGVVRLIPGANMKEESIEQFRKAINSMHYEEYQ